MISRTPGCVGIHLVFPVGIAYRVYDASIFLSWYVWNNGDIIFWVGGSQCGISAPPPTNFFNYIVVFFVLILAISVCLKGKYRKVLVIINTDIVSDKFSISNIDPFWNCGLRVKVNSVLFAKCSKCVS